VLPLVLPTGKLAASEIAQNGHGSGGTTGAQSPKRHALFGPAKLLLKVTLLPSATDKTVPNEVIWEHR
jgi:hypothetical protein